MRATQNPHLTQPQLRPLQGQHESEGYARRPVLWSDPPSNGATRKAVMMWLAKTRKRVIALFVPISCLESMDLKLKWRLRICIVALKAVLLLTTIPILDIIMLIIVIIAFK